jgi:hypothetical protein
MQGTRSAIKGQLNCFSHFEMSFLSHCREFCRPLHADYPENEAYGNISESFKGRKKPSSALMKAL